MTELKRRSRTEPNALIIHPEAGFNLPAGATFLGLKVHHDRDIPPDEGHVTWVDET